MDCPTCKFGTLVNGACDTCSYDAGEDTFNGKGIEVVELRVVEDDKPTDPYNTARFRRPDFGRTPR